MTKHLRIPMECPYPDEYIVRGITPEGKIVHLCQHNPDVKFVWLDPEGWAKHFESEQVARSHISLATRPSYNVPNEGDIVVLAVPNHKRANYERIINELVAVHLDAVEVEE